MDKLSDFIKAVRAELRLTQEQFAERFHTTKQNISHWENDKGSPSTETIIQMHNMVKGKVKLPGMENFDNPEHMVQKVPLVDYVQAGMLREAADPYEVGGGMAEVFVNGRWSRRSFALQIKGDSMSPDFKEGDIIVVDPELEPRPGDFVIAKNGANEATFKKYRPRGIDANQAMVFELSPINPDYPSMRSDTEDIFIVGVMVEHHKKYR
jgi:SOS-response transcriptional repressor LexA